MYSTYSHILTVVVYTNIYTREPASQITSQGPFLFFSFSSLFLFGKEQNTHYAITGTRRDHHHYHRRKKKRERKKEEEEEEEKRRKRGGDEVVCIEQKQQQQ